MVLARKSKRLFVLLPLLIVTAASAAPTVSNYGSSLVVSAVSPTSDTHVPILADATCNMESGNSHLAGVAAEFLKPPPAFTDSPAAPVGAKSLPAVPGALLMGLIGFLCVSLVKDRRFWLAALAGLLWLGQAGIQAVPQLAVRLSHRNHIARQLDTQLNYPYYLENSRLRSDIDGTQYIGLLRHLEGIPERKERPHVKRGAKYLAPSLRRGFRQLKTTQFAIMGRAFHIIPVTNCPAAQVEQFICFSPAFIFAQLPRGPPILA